MKALVGLLLAMTAVVVAAGSPAAIQTAGATSDLDDFMAQVLARRDQNWKKLQQFVLDEHERVDVHGPGRAPVWGEDRTYTWYIRSGFFIRSPLTANGVRVSDADRTKYEDQFLERARKREGGDGSRPAASADEPSSAGAPRDVSGLLTQSRQPQFIDTAYFLRFKFEPGKYALVGRETLDGRAVLRIEYYPARLFSHSQDKIEKRAAEGRAGRREESAATTERLMNKTSLVTLWVEPGAHQILKYTFDNVNLDFLPAAWMLRITNMQATMMMGEPFNAVWLPRDVDMTFGVMIAPGDFAFHYRVNYDHYREATTAGRIVGVSGP